MVFYVVPIAMLDMFNAPSSAPAYFKLRLKLLSIYSDIGILKNNCTEIIHKIVPFTEYLYDPISAKGVDIKMLIKVTVPNNSFPKDLI